MTDVTRGCRSHLRSYESEVFYVQWTDESIMTCKLSLEPASEELAAEGGREPRHVVRWFIYESTMSSSSTYQG